MHAHDGEVERVSDVHDDRGENPAQAERALVAVGVREDDLRNPHKCVQHCREDAAHVGKLDGRAAFYAEHGDEEQGGDGEQARAREEGVVEGAGGDGGIEEGGGDFALFQVVDLGGTVVVLEVPIPHGDGENGRADHLDEGLVCDEAAVRGGFAGKGMAFVEEDGVEGGKVGVESGEEEKPGGDADDGLLDGHFIMLREELT